MAAFISPPLSCWNLQLRVHQPLLHYTAQHCTIEMKVWGDTTVAVCSLRTTHKRTTPKHSTAHGTR